MIDKKIKLLLIEDNPGDARLIREMLCEASSDRFDLERADRLETGLKRLTKGGIDLVFLDLGLPDSQGIYTFLKVKSQEQKVPIVVLTGLEDETLGINAVRNGAQDYLVKGQVDGNLLVRSIRHAIERKRVEQALCESEEMYKTLVRTSTNAVIVTDLDGKIIEVSLQTLILHDFKRVEELLGRSALELIAPEEHEKALRNLQKTLKKGFVRNVECTLLRKDGSRFIGELNTSLIKDAYGKPKAFIATTRDITEHKRGEETIRELAYYDHLTGLLNRRGFSILAEQQLKIANWTKKNLLLLSAVFDELKSIIDSLGQSKGKQVLTEIANILKETFNESDIIARVGGHKFAVLTKGNHKENINSIITHLQKTVDAHNKKAKRSYNLSISVGIALFDPNYFCSIDELITRADKSIYKQKKRSS